jgi:proteic killer suppression protein
LPKELHEKAQRLLDKLDAAISLETLKAPPGNRLEKLKGDMAKFWSLRINDQWRVIFRWEESDAIDVDVVDYH